MNENAFDPEEFYASYAHELIALPGHPARAAFKSTLLFNSYGQRVMQDVGVIHAYADIGGCFGFGANTMAFHIANRQGVAPRTMVVEISPEAVRMGKLLFPKIEFFEGEFSRWKDNLPRLDLVSLFDVVEHVVDPESLLREVAGRSTYVMLKTPMETTGEWRGSIPPSQKGANHGNGHVNFFSPRSYERLLDRCGLDMLESRMFPSIVPVGTEAILEPERPAPPRFREVVAGPKSFAKEVIRRLPGIPWHWKRKVVGGGDHICLCRSKSVDR